MVLNGQLKEQGTNKNGMAEGLFREWHENGQLRVEVNYVDGQHDGLYNLGIIMDNYPKKQII